MGKPQENHLYTNGRFSTSMLVSRRVIIGKPMKLPFKAGMMVARIGDFG